MLCLFMQRSQRLQAAVISEKILQWCSHKAPRVFKELHLREELIGHFFSRLVRVERNKLL